MNMLALKTKVSFTQKCDLHWFHSTKNKKYKCTFLSSPKCFYWQHVYTFSPRSYTH